MKHTPTEQAVVNRVIKWAKEAKALLVCKVQPGLGLPKGFPDLIIMHKTYQYLIECKRKGEHPTPTQARLLQQLARSEYNIVMVAWPDEEESEGFRLERIQP